MRPPHGIVHEDLTVKTPSKLESQILRLDGAVGELDIRLELLEGRLQPITMVATPEPMPSTKSGEMSHTSKSVVCASLATHTDRIDSIIKRLNALLDTIDL
jgi:hypothetical protein